MHLKTGKPALVFRRLFHSVHYRPVDRIFRGFQLQPKLIDNRIDDCPICLVRTAAFRRSDQNAVAYVTGNSRLVDHRPTGGNADELDEIADNPLVALLRNVPAGPGVRFQPNVSSGAAVLNEPLFRLNHVVHSQSFGIAMEPQLKAIREQRL